MFQISAEALGSREFKRDYGTKYAYVTGAMYRAIASAELVVAMGRAGLMGFFGAGGLGLGEIEQAIHQIRAGLRPDQSFGMNFLCNPERPDMEERTADLYLKHGIRNIEAAAFTQLRPSIVRFRLHGISFNERGDIEVPNRVIAKVSRPEVAAAFMQPAPEAIRKRLVDTGALSATEAELGSRIPIADDICVEADSGGHTDGGVSFALVPAMLLLRDQMMTTYGYRKRIRVGTAGGIGTPQAAAAAFVLGADFVVTGSINQCTVEAGTSHAVKDILQDINVQDTAYAPAGDMFEVGAQVQVVKKGVFFPARGNKLYELYQRYSSLDEIPADTRNQLEQRYFGRTCQQIWEDTKAHYRQVAPAKIAEVEISPKQKMASVFKWYFAHSGRVAIEGRLSEKVNFQNPLRTGAGCF